MKPGTYCIILLILLLTACQPVPSPDSTTASPIRTPTQPATVTPTVTPSYPPQCYFNWATQPLPELSAEVQAAMERAGLTGITARAETYGENCYDSQTNEAVYFATLETDFRVNVEVENLEDREALGDLLEKILVVVDGFPTEAMPGPRPGYIGVNFQAGENMLYLWFTITEGEAARAQGYHGAGLLDILQNK